MRYEGTIYRPPSEARSLIVQATVGCTHNKCTFCPMYKDKKFHIRSFEDILRDLNEARCDYPAVDRIFFADGDALCLSTPRLLEIFGAARAIFPECERIAVYSRATHVLRKSDEELKELRDAGLGIVYIGAESGSDEILSLVNKGETVSEILEGVQKAEADGIKASVTFISGLGGKKLMEEHAVSTGRMIGEMGASYVGLLTLMPAPGTKMFKDMVDGRFVPLNKLEVEQELKLILQNADCEKPCVFRSNHASNHLVLSGTLPQDRNAMIRQVDEAMLSGQFRKK